MTLEEWKPKHILINMDEAWPQGEHTYQFALFAANQQRRLDSYMNAHMLTRSNKQPGTHKPPESIFHYYSTVSWRQGWAMLHCSCARGGLSMTFGLKHELLGRGKTQQGAEKDVTDAGTRLCPLYTHVETRSLKLTGYGTGFVLSDVAAILFV